MKQYDLDGINFLTIRDKSINCNKEAISNYIKAIKQLVKVMINEGNSKIRIHDPLILRHISLYALCKDFRDIFINILVLLNSAVNNCSIIRACRGKIV